MVACIAQIAEAGGHPSLQKRKEKKNLFSKASEEPQKFRYGPVLQQQEVFSQSAKP